MFGGIKVPFYLSAMKNIKISPDLHQALKVYCAKAGINMNSFANKILAKAISKPSTAKKQKSQS